MKKIRHLGAIALILGMVAGCNLTSAPPSPLPRVSPKPRVQKPAAQPPIASATNNRNLLLGNPSNAASSIASTDNYLMVKLQYALSYNSKTGFRGSSIHLGLGQPTAKTASAPTIPYPLLGTKSAQTITREAATTGDTLHPVPTAPATKRTTALPF